MSSDEQTRSERAAERADWSIHRYELGEEPAENLSATTTPEERLGMMWELTLQAWSLSARATARLRAPRDPRPHRPSAPMSAAAEEFPSSP